MADALTPRTPCLNPRCGRTCKQEHPGEEMVCGKCWKTLPVSLTRRYKALKARDRRIDRLARRKRTGIYNTPYQLSIMAQQHDRLWCANWNRIRAFFQTPDKPEGLDTFLEEMKF